MIFSFLIDFLFGNYLSINTFFILCDIGDKKIYDVLFVSILYDFLFKKFLLFSFLLLLFYFVFRNFKINGKYYYIENVLVYIIFYFICIGKYFDLYMFLVGGLLQIIYLYLSRKLLN